MARLQLKRRASSLPRGGCQLPSLDRPGDTVLVWDQVTGLNQEQNHIRALSIRSCVHRARPAFHSLLTWVTGAWGGGGRKVENCRNGCVSSLPEHRSEWDWCWDRRECRTDQVVILCGGQVARGLSDRHGELRGNSLSASGAGASVGHAGRTPHLLAPRSGFECSRRSSRSAWSVAVSPRFSGCDPPCGGACISSVNTHRLSKQKAVTPRRALSIHSMHKGDPSLKPKSPAGNPSDLSP